jgi:hypothetical protein
LGSDAAEPHAVRKPRLNGRVNYLQPTSGHAPRRTAAFPNGDVRDGLKLRGTESLRGAPQTQLDVHRS